MQFAHWLTHWPLGDLDANLEIQFSSLLYWLVHSELLLIRPSDEQYRTLLMISQYRFRQWLGAIRQQAITWANVDPDLCRRMECWPRSMSQYVVIRPQWVNHHFTSHDKLESWWYPISLKLWENCLSSYDTLHENAPKYFIVCLNCNIWHPYQVIWWVLAACTSHLAGNCRNPQKAGIPIASVTITLAV